MWGCLKMCVTIWCFTNATLLFSGITCLIQITTYEGGDFIVDALALRAYLYKLNDAFTDPKKVKVSIFFLI